MVQMPNDTEIRGTHVTSATVDDNIRAVPNSEPRVVAMSTPMGESLFSEMFDNLVRPTTAISNGVEGRVPEAIIYDDVIDSSQVGEIVLSNRRIEEAVRMVHMPTTMGTTSMNGGVEERVSYDISTPYPIYIDDIEEDKKPTKITDCKIRVTPEQSAEIQKICFSRGIEWGVGGKKIQYLDTSKYLCMERSIITYGTSDSSFNERNLIEIKAEDFIAMFGGNVKKEKPVKILYMKEHTASKLNKITSNLFGVPITTMMDSSKDFGTNDDKRISNTDEGNFFVGDVKNKIKLGKILSATTELKDFEIEKVVSEWKRQYEVDIEQVEISSDVEDIYNSSSCGGSCMSGQKSGMFDIYHDIGSKVAYVADKHGDLAARALLHDLTNIRTNMRVKVIDRIFFNDEVSKLTIEKWASEKGYTQIYSNSKEPLISGIIEQQYDLVPYIDSIYYVVDYAGGYRLSNHSSFTGASNVDACQQTGGGSDEGTISNAIGEDHVYCIDSDSHEHIDNVFRCETDDEYYSTDDDLVYIEGEYYLADDDNVAYDEYECSYNFIDNLKETIDGSYTSNEDYCLIDTGKYEGLYDHIDNLCTVEGILCHADDNPTFIEDLDEYTLDTDDYFEHSNGVWYSYKEIKDEEESTDEVA